MGLSELDIRNRLNFLIKDSEGTDATNIQLPVMVYIQLSCAFGDIDTSTAIKLNIEYLTILESKKHRGKI